VCDALGQHYPYFIQQVRGVKKFTVQMARMISEYTDGEVTIDDLIPYIRPTHCSKCKQLLPCDEKD
jgi:DNA-binding transcriptional regulator YdaS (Cro superfamily)